MGDSGLIGGTPGGRRDTTMMRDIAKIKLRQGHDTVQALLDQLEQQSELAKLYSGREHDRFKYRVRELEVDIPQGTGESQRHAVPTRDVSRNGCCFLTGRFVYPGTEVTVHLVTVHAHAQAVRGTVRRCRYLQGTGSLHEVGVEFMHPIDVAMFDPRASTIRVLLADSDPTVPILVAHLLKAANVELMTVKSVDEIKKIVNDQAIDIVLVEVDSDREAALKTIQELRAEGFFRPIVGLSASGSPDLQNETLQAGASGFVPKPLNRDNLMSVVMTVKDEPLISTLVHDADMVGLIDNFVQSLAQRTRELEQAFAAQDRAALLKVVRSVKGDGGSYGFDIITDAAAEVESLLEQEGELSAMREKLNELVRFCSAARPASCEVEEPKAKKRPAAPTPAAVTPSPASD